MEHLVHDVEKHVLHAYVGASYMPLICLVSRRWRILMNLCCAKAPVYCCGCSAENKALSIPTVISNRGAISLADVARDGGIGLLRWTQSMGAKRWLRQCTFKHCLTAAVRHGREELVRQFLDGSFPPQVVDVQLVYQAARGGHERIMLFLIDVWHTIHYVDSSMSFLDFYGPFILGAAARGGHVHLLRQWCDEWKPKTAMGFSLIAEQAARGGREELLKWLYTERFGYVGPLPEEECVDVTQIMSEAARGGHENIVRLAHDVLGASNVGKALIAATASGHERIVRLCCDEYKATAVQINDALARARLMGHADIERFLSEKYTGGCCSV